jgi:hypothetical protein
MSKPQVVIPRFEVLRRGKVLQTLPINRNRIVVGSEEGAHLRLKHPAIAPRHLEVTVVNGRYLEAANLAGEGRVLLGGQPMNRARLRAGDELDLGPVTLRLAYGTKDSLPASAGAPAAGGGVTEAGDDEEEETVEGAAPLSETTSSGKGLRAPPPAVGGGRGAIDAESDTSSRLSTLGELLVAPGTTTSESLPVLPSPETTESSKLAVDLDETVLDPAPLVTIEPPGGKAQEVPLRVGSFVVGAGRCAFRLSYPGVAPAHTEIMVMPDGIVYVKHLAGSGLLTLRNGAPIQFARWSAGDRLQVGPVAMRLDLVSRDALTGSSHVSQITSAHTGQLRQPEELTDEATMPGDAPIAARAADDSLRDSDVGVRTFSGRALHRSVTEEGPAPLAEPLVKVHSTARQPGAAKKKPKKRRVASEARSNSVVVSLDVSSYETFQSFDDDLEYRPAAARRYFLPALVALLLVLLGGQYMSFQSRTGEDGTGWGSGPQTARGSSGLGDATRGATTAGEGPVQVGDVEAARRRAAAAGARRAGGGSKGMDIDWDDTRGMYFEGPRRSSYTGAGGGDIVARPADEIERSEAVAAPTSVGGDQGFVDMKIVNQQVSSAHRKFRYCYEQARQTDDRLEGTMWLNMTLGMDGRIRGVVVEGRSTLKSEAMRKCMEKKLFSLPMPKPSGSPVTFSAPFQFAPTGP